MTPTQILFACLLVLLANICVTAAGVAIIVKLWTEQLKDRKFDVRETRSGPSVPGTPGHSPAHPTPTHHLSDVLAARARAGWGPPARDAAIDAIADEVTDRVLAARLRAERLPGPQGSADPPAPHGRQEPPVSRRGGDPPS